MKIRLSKLGLVVLSVLTLSGGLFGSRVLANQRNEQLDARAEAFRGTVINYHTGNTNHYHEFTYRWDDYEKYYSIPPVGDTVWVDEDHQVNVPSNYKRDGWHVVTYPRSSNLQFEVPILKWVAHQGHSADANTLVKDNRSTGVGRWAGKAFNTVGNCKSGGLISWHPYCADCGALLGAPNANAPDTFANYTNHYFLKEDVGKVDYYDLGEDTGTGCPACGSNQTAFDQSGSHTCRKAQPNRYHVIYDGNGATSGSMGYSRHMWDNYSGTWFKSNDKGEFTEQSNTADFSAQTNLKKNEYKRDGYQFLGWSRTPNGTVEFTDGQEILNLAGKDKNMDEITLYAVWAPNNYQVKYNGNGATSGTMANSSHVYGTASPLSANKFVKQFSVTYDNNYTGSTDTVRKVNAAFQGWATTASGSVEYSDKESISKPPSSLSGSVANLYAKWGSASDTAPTPTRKGYTFDGWYTAATGGTLVVKGGAKHTVTSNKTLYAHWTPLSYTIKYDYATNGGTSATKTTDTKKWGEKLDLTPTATKKNHTFAGWALTPTGKKETSLTIGSGSLANVSTTNRTITLYALYTKNSYKIHYNKNTGTGTQMPDSTHYYGEASKLSKNTYTKNTTIIYDYNDGTSKTEKVVVPWEFAGWLDAPTDVEANASYPDGGTITNPPSNISNGVANLYANFSPNWTKAPTPRREGYVFLGWYDSKTGGKLISMTEDGVWQPIQDRTVYAHWERAEVRVYYDYKTNGGTDSTAPKPPAYNKYYLGDTINQSYTATPPKNMKFTGWGLDSPTGQVYSKLVVGEGPLAGYGLGSTEESDAIAVVPEPSGVSNYLFTDDEQASVVATTGEVVTLYAQFDQAGFTINYNGNGATGGSTASSKHEFGVASKLTKNGFIRQNKVTLKYNDGSTADKVNTIKHKFVEWNTKADGSGYVFTDQKTITDWPEDISSGSDTLYAQWDIYGFDVPTATRKGYTLDYWQDQDGKKYYSSSRIDAVTKDLVLTAVWRKIPVQIKYDYTTNGGSSSNAPKPYATKYIGDKINLSYTATKANNDFLGWALTPKGTPQKNLVVGTPPTDPFSSTRALKEMTTAPKEQVEEFIESGTEESGASASPRVGSDPVITLYAIFTPSSFTIDYDGNGSTSGSTASTTHIFGTPSPLAQNGFERDYVINLKYNDDGNDADNLPDTPDNEVKIRSDFINWNTEPDGSGTTYQEEQTITGWDESQLVNKHDTLYAQWDLKDYTFERPYRKGYDFLYWEGADGSVYHAGETIHDIDRNMEFEAVWEILDVYVVYDYQTNGGTSSNAPQPYVVQHVWDKIRLDYTAVKPNYTFMGWSLNNSSKIETDLTIGIPPADPFEQGKVTVKYGLASKIKLPEFKFIETGNKVETQGFSNIASRGRPGYMIVLYAQFKPNNFIIHYDGNNSDSGSMADTEHYYGVEKPLRKNTFEKDVNVKYDYNDGSTPNESVTIPQKFTGWSEVRNGSKVYDDEQVITEPPSTVQNGEATIYAKWQSKEIVAPDPERPGYIFEGWYDINGKKVVDGGEPWTPTDDTDLTGKWTQVQYKVVYDYKENGGNSISGPETVTHQYGEAIDLSVKATKTGWEFIGWSLDMDEHEVEDRLIIGQPPLDNLTPDKNNTVEIRLYAVYRKDITVTYHDYDETGKSRETEKIVPIWNKETSEDIVLLNIGALKGYDILGWSTGTQATDNQTFYQPKDVYNVSKDTDFYANYTKEITVHYETYGGTPEPQDQKGQIYKNASGTTSKLIVTIADAVDRDPSKFIEWNDKEDGSGKAYQPGQKAQFDKDVTLHAMYETCVELTFDLNGGYLQFDNGSTSTEDITLRGMSYKQNGYPFNIVGGKTQAVDGQYGAQGDVTFADGSNPDDDDTFNSYGKSYSSDGINADIKRDGYRFIGWSTNPDAKVPDMTDEISLDVYDENRSEVYTTTQEKTTLYAVWEGLLTIRARLDRVLGNEIEHRTAYSTSVGTLVSGTAYLRAGEQGKYYIETNGKTHEIEVMFDARINAMYGPDSKYKDKLNSDTSTVTTDDWVNMAIPFSSMDGLTSGLNRRVTYKTVQDTGAKFERTMYLPLYLNKEGMDNSYDPIYGGIYTLSIQATNKDSFYYNHLGIAETAIANINIYVDPEDIGSGDGDSTLDDLRNKVKIILK